MIYYDGITENELLTMWDFAGKEHFATFEDFKDDYIKTRKKERQKRKDDIERHNWLYSIDG